MRTESTRGYFGGLTQSPVLNSAGATIFASANGCSTFVYWIISIGGDQCCQYGPSPRGNVMVPFQPSNLPVSSALTTSSTRSLLAMLTASAITSICAYEFS